MYGRIDDISEVFGNATTEGFTELAELDSNDDGIISAADARVADIKLWRDADGDGRTDEGELISLTEGGITQIDLGATKLDGVEREGNRIFHTSQVTFADGSTTGIDDVWFKNTELNSMNLWLNRLRGIW